MWWFVISRKKVQVGLTLLGLVILLGAGMRQPVQPDTTVLSYGVAGRIIAIDPGHGGIDPGAVGRTTGVPEKDITLAIAKNLAQTLSQAGAMVVLTRTSDDDLSDEGFKGPLIERKRQDLARRVDKAHRLKADLYLSIHTNADPSPRWHGAQAFYCHNSPSAQKLAVCIQDEMVRILGNNKRKAKEGGFFVMEKTRMPAVIVEVGFISNPVEERLLTNPSYQSKVAFAIFSGIARYYAEEDRP